MEIIVEEQHVLSKTVWFTWCAKPYLLWKLFNKYFKILSAALIGTLRIKALPNWNNNENELNAWKMNKMLIIFKPVAGNRIIKVYIMVAVLHKVYVMKRTILDIA